MKSNPVQQIPTKPRFLVKAPLRGAFTRNLGLVCSQSAVSKYAKENLKPKKLWHTRSVRHSFLGFGFYYAFQKISYGLRKRKALQISVNIKLSRLTP